METSHGGSQFKTLTPRDSDYMSYMLGSFSDTERAIPQATLNRQSAAEIVTFEIRPICALDVAPLWKKLLLLLKPQAWLTVLVPFTVIANLEPQVIGFDGWTLGLVLTLLMIFANWQTDLADHLEGWDRLHGGTARSVLQNGWFTGQQLQRWSKLLLFFTVVLGLPLLFKLPWVLVPYALGVLSLLLLLPRWWRKSIWPGFSSLCIFLLTGPLLTVGIDLAFDGNFSLPSLILGFCWGLWMSFVRQQRIYTKQWPLQQKRSTFFFLGLGFDRSKALMKVMIALIPAMMVLATLFFRGGSAWFFPMLTVHSAFVFLELQYNEQVQSSVGSPLERLQTVFHWHHYAIALTMVIGSFVWKNLI